MVVNCSIIKTFYCIMKKDQIRIMIADDHEMVRQTWKFLLEQHYEFEIIAECTNGEEAIEMSQALNPDVILMDINMSPVNGFEATTKLTAMLPAIKIIGISVHNLPAYARNMLRLGAKGYVTKNVSQEEMIRAIDEVVKGNIYICDEIRKKMNSSENE